MKVLHIIDSLNKGGAEFLLLNSIKYLHVKHPSIINYLVTLRESGDLINEIKKIAETYNLEFKGLKDLIKTTKKLNFIINKLKIDVVHSHLVDSTIISRLAIPKGVKLVTTYHSVLYNPHTVNYSKLRFIIDKTTSYKTDWNIYVSNTVRNHIIDRISPSNPGSVLVNFPSPSFKPLYKFNPDQQLRIVSVGNLKEVKNHELAINALSKLRYLPISLDIYGEGHLRSHLEKLIAKCNVNVRLLGLKEITSELLVQYDLFLMTSQYEGMPISLLESMCSGLPAVLNDLPMLRETADTAAFYFEYNNSSSLKEMLISIFNNKIVLKELSHIALEQSNKYSIDDYVEKLTSIYNSLTIRI